MKKYIFICNTCNLALVLQRVGIDDWMSKRKTKLECKREKTKLFYLNNLLMKKQLELEEGTEEREFMLQEFDNG